MSLYAAEFITLNNKMAFHVSRKKGWEATISDAVDSYSEVLSGYLVLTVCDFLVDNLVVVIGAMVGDRFQEGSRRPALLLARLNVHKPPT